MTCAQFRDLCVRHKSDKATDHRYDLIYPRYLEQYQDAEFVIYEIGVFRGASMRVWSEYFPKAHIFGFDINERAASYDNGRGQVHITDVSSPGFADLVATLPKPDVVVDDGSHKEVDQLAAFDTLWPLLPDYGWYFIEDLSARHTSRRRVEWGDYTATIGRQASELLHGTATHEIGEIHVHPEICVFRKMLTYGL